ncbi:hypothetical protein CROQUDRAFT_87223 [Cronartium quercuum f. sp. fusiforme G11]|uniref:Uncharacterized protein n=1 Tax=Cronartium quercuum f. sp. fusiforme G11 TaxID=708437 RepID=A0A9P6TFW1_9BASI|nr:hypothetical protein CROQUDRAFT_87223 [Cronartium quercuum f. sp. fusiforme G11]
MLPDPTPHPQLIILSSLSDQKTYLLAQVLPVFKVLVARLEANGLQLTVTAKSSAGDAFRALRMRFYPQCNIALARSPATSNVVNHTTLGITNELLALDDSCTPHNVILDPQPSDLGARHLKALLRFPNKTLSRLFEFTQRDPGLNRPLCATSFSA